MHLTNWSVSCKCTCTHRETCRLHTGHMVLWPSPQLQSFLLYTVSLFQVFMFSHCLVLQTGKWAHQRSPRCCLNGSVVGTTGLVCPRMSAEGWWLSASCLAADVCSLSVLLWLDQKHTEYKTCPMKADVQQKTVWLLSQRSSGSRLIHVHTHTHIVDFSWQPCGRTSRRKCTAV